MKFTKILALVLAICLVSVVFVACDGDDKNKGESTTGANSSTTAETTAAKTDVKINLTVKDSDGKVKYEGDVTCNGTLGDAIGALCALEDLDDDCFNSSGLLVKIGELSGNDWKVYYKNEGSNNALKDISIKTHAVKEGEKIVVELKK